MCVCGHPVRLHHEDVCLLAGCSCNDCLEPEAVAEACKTSPKGDSKPAPDDGLREQYTAAIHRYDYDNLLATTDIPSDYHRGEADAVMAVRDVRLEQLIKECDSLGRESDRLRRDWVAMHERAERAEAALARARALHVSSKDTRGVGRVSATGAWTPYCEHDSEDWPCPTMHALDGTDATTTEESHQ